MISFRREEGEGGKRRRGKRERDGKGGGGYNSLYLRAKAFMTLFCIVSTLLRPVSLLSTPLLVGVSGVRAREDSDDPGGSGGRKRRRGEEEERRP